MSPKKPPRVREPIQVYLSPEDRAILDRVAKTAGVSRAEVLRRGIRRMSAEVNADEHPGIKAMRELAAGWPDDTPNDLGMRHDHYLDEIYMDNHEPKDE